MDNFVAVSVPVNVGCEVGAGTSPPSHLAQPNARGRKPGSHDRLQTSHYFPVAMSEGCGDCAVVANPISTHFDHPHILAVEIA